jgi:hypothetical protein
MGVLSFRKLDELCKAHPAVFNHAASPSAEELNTFSKQLGQQPYVKGMRARGHLQRAIKLLEDAFGKGRVPGKPERLSDDDWQALRSQKRLEREVRFVQRLAVIAGPKGQQLPHYGPPEWKYKKEVAIEAINDASGKLNVLLQDEFLLSALASGEKLSQLIELRKLLPKVAEVLTDVTVDYAVIRDGKYAKSYQMVNRVVDTCCRIYGDCDLKILGKILECSWLRRDDWDGDPRRVRELMNETIDRKQNEHGLRLAKEDYVGAGLVGEWQSMLAWPPATTLDPPWMEA